MTTDQTCFFTSADRSVFPRVELEASFCVGAGNKKETSLSIYQQEPSPAFEGMSNKVSREGINWVAAHGRIFTSSSLKTTSTLFSRSAKHHPPNNTIPSYVATGTARSLGYEFLRQLSRNPYNTVIGLVRKKAATDAKVAADKLPSNIHIVEADITSLAAQKA